MIKLIKDILFVTIDLVIFYLLVRILIAWSENING